jgi:hypothetical protein
MHLSPAALDTAIRLLETGTENTRTARGGIVEAAGTEGVKVSLRDEKVVRLRMRVNAANASARQTSVVSETRWLA